MKTLLITCTFIAIVAALAGAGMFMLRGGSSRERESRMARALALRVGLSVLLFGCILLAWKFGWIVPTGLPITR